MQRVRFVRSHRQEKGPLYEKPSRRYPVSGETECLEYALANKEAFGIWGGTSERRAAKAEAAAEG